MLIYDNVYIFQRGERMFVRNIYKLQGKKKHWWVLSFLGVNHAQTSDVKSGRSTDFIVSSAESSVRMQDFCILVVCQRDASSEQSFFYSLIANVKPH